MVRRLEHLVERERANTVAGWGLVVVILVVAAFVLRSGGAITGVLGVAVAAAVVAPSVRHRSPHVLLPAELVGIALLALLAHEVVPWGPVATGAAYLVIAVTSFFAAIAIHRYSRVELVPSFAAAFVAMVTMTAATTWTLGGWAVDAIAGTTYVASNTALMVELVVATATGNGAGVLIYGYCRRTSPASRPPPAHDPPDERRPADQDWLDPPYRSRPRLADRLALSERRQRRLVRQLQVGLVGVTALGLAVADLAVLVTGLGALGATFLPAVLRRDLRVPMDVGHALWIAAAVFLHTLGTVYLYEATFWWHNLTHAVSGSLVAGIGYATFRAVDEHTTWLQFPPRFMFLLIVLFTVSAGVLWEILEFATDELWLALGRDEDVAAQYGLDDTMTDMVSNVVGAVVVGLWGTTYLDAVAARARELILER